MNHCPTDCRYSDIASLMLLDVLMMASLPFIINSISIRIYKQFCFLPSTHYHTMYHNISSSLNLDDAYGCGMCHLEGSSDMRASLFTFDCSEPVWAGPLLNMWCLYFFVRMSIRLSTLRAEESLLHVYRLGYFFNYNRISSVSRGD